MVSPEQQPNDPTQEPLRRESVWSDLSWGFGWGPSDEESNRIPEALEEWNTQQIKNEQVEPRRLDSDWS